MTSYRLEETEAAALGLPPGIYHSTDRKLLQKMNEDVRRLPRVVDLRWYAADEPIPHLDDTIVPAIDFFCEHKGKDGKKIWDHICLGYGPQLHFDDRVWLCDPEHYSRDLCLGLQFWIEKRVDPIIEHPRTMRGYGVTDFREVSYDLLALTASYWVR